jgi:uncharacterized damage-inducible protein DinB
MKNEETINVLKFNNRVLNINLAGITQEESLKSPEAGGNCINWVLGHIIVSRNDINEIVGLGKISDERLENLYSRGTQNINRENAEKIETLLEIFNGSQKALEDKVAETDLSSNADSLKELTFLAFHEAYHTGQTGLLRRVAGKEGAIK